MSDIIGGVAFGIVVGGFLALAVMAAITVFIALEFCWRTIVRLLRRATTKEGGNG